VFLPPSTPAAPLAGELPPGQGGSAQPSTVPFTIRIDLVSGRLDLSGPLTHRTTHLLYDGLSTLVHADADQWVVDALGLTDCDHAGVRAIGLAYRRALRHGRRMVLTGASPALRRVLTRVRLDHHVLAAAHGSGGRTAGPAEGARGQAPASGGSLPATRSRPAAVSTPPDALGEAGVGP
jgi:anti-anti-sigma regulatory factor